MFVSLISRLISIALFVCALGIGSFTALMAQWVDNTPEYIGTAIFFGATLLCVWFGVLFWNVAEHKQAQALS